MRRIGRRGEVPIAARCPTRGALLHCLPGVTQPRNQGDRVGFCENCGKRRTPGATFCTGCGTAFSHPEPGGSPAMATVLRPQPAAIGYRPPPPWPGPAPATPRYAAATTVLWILAAVVVLACAACSLIAATALESAPSWLARWLLLRPSTSSLTAYRTETIALIVISLGGGVGFVARAAVARVLALLLGLATVGIVVGNLIALDLDRRSIAILFSQPESILTWIVVTLCLYCVASGAFGAGRGLQVAVSSIAAVGVTATFAVVAVTTGPDLSVYYSGNVAGAYSPDPDQPTTSSGDETYAGVPGSCADGWDTELNVSTANIVATVCVWSDGTAYLLASGPGSDSIDAMAYSTEAGWHAQTGTLEYDVDPDVVAVYRNDVLEIDEATTNAPSDNASGRDDFDQLADLVRIAHDGRVSVERLQRLTLYGHCSSRRTAATVLRTVLRNRGGLVSAARRLEARSSDDLPVAEFRQAMAASYQADRAWGRWIDSSWSPWISRSCSSGLDHGTNFATFNHYNRQATRAKRTFVARYDPIAAAQGRRSNWTDVNI